MNVENDQSPKLSQDQQHVPNSLGPNPILINKQIPEEEKKVLNKVEKKFSNDCE